MKITDLNVDGFGVWNGLNVEGLSTEMTVFFGHNEAGKTTLMQFIRAVLYGFSSERRSIYLPPVNGGTPGGSLVVSSLQGRFQVYRKTQPGDAPLLGKVTVLGPNGRSHGQHHLNQLLSGIDESIFNNVFAVGIRELQELGTLNDTQAAEELYNLTSGVDRVSLVDVMRELETARKRLLHPGDEPAQLSKLLNQRETLQLEIEQLLGRGKRWCELSASQRATTAELGELETEIARSEQASRIVELSLQVYDKWHQRRIVEEELSHIGEVPEIPEGAIDRLDELNDQIDAQRQQIQPLKKRQAEIRRESSGLPINRKLCAQAARIDALCEYSPWLASLEKQIRGLEDEVARTQSEAVEKNKSFGISSGVVLTNLPVVSQRTMKLLRGPARELRDTKRRRSEAKGVYQTSREMANQYAVRLESEMGQRQERDVQAALEKAGHTVTQLRRRIQVEERLEKMDRQRKELESEKQELLDNRVLPVRLVVAIGALFVFGVVLMLSSLFGWWFSVLSSEAAFALSVFGFVFSALAVGWKVVLERTTADELDNCSRQLSRLRSQIDQFQQERDQLDHELPRGGGPLDARLDTAETELQDLEKMVPLDKDGNAASQQSKSARMTAEDADRARKEAKRRWCKTLEHVGLPRTLTPKQVQQLGAHSEVNSKLQDQLNRVYEQLEQRKQERRELADRISLVVEDTGMETVSDEPHVRISELSNALASQRKMMERLNEFKREYKELHQQERGHSTILKKLTRQRQALLIEASVADEEELRHRAGLLERVAELSLKHEDLSEQIVAVIRGHCSEEEICQQLGSTEKPELEQRWDRLITRLQDSQTHLTKLHQRRGEITQEMKLLAEDRRMPAAQLELKCIEQKIAKSVRRWQVLAVTFQLLESIREIYESERQPETLAEASDYMRQLSDGKYTRIWTPLSQNVLRVDDVEGVSLPLEVLSRGTREAVFLSLRLALTAAYARRGIQLPMILDDVLVNLDAHRAQATVKVLRRFAAAGQQLLFFTCHDHIKEMFRTAEVEVRDLPSHNTINAVVEAEPIKTRRRKRRAKPRARVVETPPPNENCQFRPWQTTIIAPLAPQTQLTEEQVAAQTVNGLPTDIEQIAAAPVPEPPVDEGVALEKSPSDNTKDADVALLDLNKQLHEAAEETDDLYDGEPEEDASCDQDAGELEEYEEEFDEDELDEEDDDDEEYDEEDDDVEYDEEEYDEEEYDEEDEEQECEEESEVGLEGATEYEEEDAEQSEASSDIKPFTWDSPEMWTDEGREDAA